MEKDLIKVTIKSDGLGGYGYFRNGKNIDQVSHNDDVWIMTENGDLEADLVDQGQFGWSIKFLDKFEGLEVYIRD